MRATAPVPQGAQPAVVAAALFADDAIPPPVEATAAPPRWRRRSLSALAKYRRGGKAGGDGDENRHQAVQRGIAEGKGVQVALDPLALEIELHRILAQKFFITEQINARFE